LDGFGATQYSYTCLLQFPPKELDLSPRRKAAGFFCPFLAYPQDSNHRPRVNNNLFFGPGDYMQLPQYF